MSAVQPNDSRVMPRYPVYIPSKGRVEPGLTPRFLDADGVPFWVVVEPQEAEAYRARWGEARVLVLPFTNPGSVIPARNWIKAHATALGAERHWQLDDNIWSIGRRYKGRRIRCDAGIALRVVEDFVDRYENVAVAGLNYEMFLANGHSHPPFVLNVHVYSCTLILNTLPHQWRGRYNEDTDLCLQVLADGWCTVLFNAFYCSKNATMEMGGGNTDALYHGDGRLKMARALERLWPGVVTTERRFRRPQHVVKDGWKRFDTPLRRKPGVVIPPGANEYGMSLRQVAPVIQSPRVRRLVAEYAQRQDGEDT